MPEAMSLRDYFAGKALNGLLAQNNFGDAMARGGYAKCSYEIADAMIEERELKSAAHVIAEYIRKEGRNNGPRHD